MLTGSSVRGCSCRFLLFQGGSLSLDSALSFSLAFQDQTKSLTRLSGLTFAKNDETTRNDLKSIEKEHREINDETHCFAQQNPTINGDGLRIPPFTSSFVAWRPPMRPSGGTM